jgi:hypothetical protein
MNGGAVMNPKRPTLKLFLVAFAASLLSAIVLGAGEARACMCEVLSPEEQLRVSEAVFSGKVMSVGEATSGDTSPAPETCWQRSKVDQINALKLTTLGLFLAV